MFASICEVRSQVAHHFSFVINGAAAHFALRDEDRQQSRRGEGTMLKTRIPPVDVGTCSDDLREALEEQRKLWGAPLYPYLFYARHPAYFRAAKAMWAALQE